MRSPPTASDDRSHRHTFCSRFTNRFSHNTECYRLQEREAAVKQDDTGSTLPEAQALLKKHLALEAELAARYVVRHLPRQ